MHTAHHCDALSGNHTNLPDGGVGTALKVCPPRAVSKTAILLLCLIEWTEQLIQILRISYYKLICLNSYIIDFTF